MRIEIGPVSRLSALEWLDYADQVVGVLRNSAPTSTPDGVLEAFEQLMDEWSIQAAEPEDFYWESERPTDQVEYLVKALYEAGLAIEEQHEVGAAELRPSGADEFHVAIVSQVLAALEHESEACKQFVEMLRGDWGVAGD